jgi:hypothetical protein
MESTMESTTSNEKFRVLRVFDQNGDTIDFKVPPHPPDQT